MMRAHVFYTDIPADLAENATRYDGSGDGQRVGPLLMQLPGLSDFAECVELDGGAVVLRFDWVPAASEERRNLSDYLTHNGISFHVTRD
jgi:hypothetical protein